MQYPDAQTSHGECDIVPNMNPFRPENSWDYENGFYLTTHPKRIGKLLAQYEIYKLITSLPGQVVELGVFKAASLMRLLTFRELLENSDSRQIVGFDSFGSFAPQNEATDAAFISEFEIEAGTGFSAETIDAFIRAKPFANYELIAGDVTSTVPKFLTAKLHFQIALLHLDLDVYGPTKAMLDLLYPRIVRGGVVMVDDYAHTPGATRAVNEFLERTPQQLTKSSIAHIPAYFTKA